MTFKKFESKDILYNVLETNPEQLFEIHDAKVYRNKQTHVVGQFTSSVPNVPTGFVSLFELNVDRNATDTGLIYPFVTKAGSLNGFGTISTENFNSDFLYGDQITGSYPLSASISSERYTVGQSRPKIQALRTALDSYQIWSKSFAYSSLSWFTR